MPQRIQRQRTRGWKAPVGAIYVGRPTRFGNPYTVEEFGLELSLQLFEETARGGFDHYRPPNVASALWEHWERVHAIHWKWMIRIRLHPVKAIRAELRGKDLMCWCPLDRACHADVLLKIANE